MDYNLLVVVMYHAKGDLTNYIQVKKQFGCKHYLKRVKMLRSVDIKR